KNLYYLQENAKQAIASMSRTQFDAILEMSENDGMKSQFEAVKSQDVIDKADEDVKPFILLVVDKGEGLKAAENLLQKTNANPVITAGHP
ncbi:EVE domain-containing protein, partial [Staphylococcus aureus]|nr:EVE domain-containing protein [Staphylococcus aureus]